jgi:hypothetical protein
VEIKEKIQPSGIVALLKLIGHQLDVAHLDIETCRGEDTLICQGEMKALRKIHNLFTIKNKNKD